MWPSAERSAAPALRRLLVFGRVLARAVLSGLAVLASFSGLPRAACAQAALPISVEREPGAEDCPDTAGLVARVQAIIGRGTLPDSTPYRITFSRGPQSFTAAIRSGEGNGNVRFLDAREPNCSALAHATAIALAVLFDADLGGKNLDEQSEAQPAEPPSAPPQEVEPPAQKPVPPAEPPPVLEPTDRTPNARLQPSLALGAVALVGVLRPAALGLVADAGLELERVRASLGLLWLTPQTIELAPGSAREDLISSNLRLCLALTRAGALRFELCSGALIGAATAEARGFTSNERHTELFLAFPAELSLSARSGVIGWQLGASALLLAPPNEFEVEGRGPTYRPAPVAGLFALRMFFEPLR